MITVSLKMMKSPNDDVRAAEADKLISTLELIEDTPMYVF